MRCRLPPSRRDFSHRAGERERGRTLLGEKGLVRAKQGVRVPATLAKMHPEALVPPKDPAAECGPGVSATAAGRVEGRTEEGDKLQKHTQTKKKKSKKAEEKKPRGGKRDPGESRRPGPHAEPLNRGDADAAGRGEGRASRCGCGGDKRPVVFQS